jgi:glucose-1-phosphate adenylyltransferase
MITDGCEVAPGARIERSVLSPGVLVREGAVIRESVILTDCVIERDAVIEHSILDKKVHVGEKARIGAVRAGFEPVITMVGKNCHVAAGMVVEPGAVIGPDVRESDFSSSVVRGSDYIQTKRLPYEI